MKKIILSLLAIAMLAGFSNTIVAQSNADCDALATLVRPISIVNDVAMDFKTIAGSATAGTVLMTAAATTVTTPSGGVTEIDGTPTAGKFTVTGNGAQVFTITLPTGDCTLTRTGGGDITVDTWTCSETVTTATLSGATVDEGTLTFYVGGTLNVGANELAGEYSGSFNIIVDYN